MRSWGYFFEVTLQYVASWKFYGRKFDFFFYVMNLNEHWARSCSTMTKNHYKYMIKLIGLAHYIPILIRIALCDGTDRSKRHYSPMIFKSWGLLTVAAWVLNGSFQNQTDTCELDQSSFWKDSWVIETIIIWRKKLYFRYWGY